MQVRVGFFGTLGIVFIILKLCAVIDWDWWVVLSPIWGGFLLWLICLAAIAILDRL